MRISTVLRLPLVLAGCAILAACSGSGVTTVTPSAASGAPFAPHSFDPTDSWMDPSAVKGDLLYVSDTRGSVDVFSYPAGKPVGVLRGFRNPAGLCSDPKGDVYVVDSDALDIVKFKHGGTKPIKTLLMFGYYPFSCSEDPHTGNLAVTNFTSQSQGAGSLSVFQSGEVIPASYTYGPINAFLFCGYDNHSNVFADGSDAGSRHTKFAELANGSSTVTAVTLDKDITYPGGVQWDGSYLAVQDTATRILYRFKMSGSSGKSVSTTRFEGDKTALAHEFWISGKQIVMPYGDVSRHVAKVGFWNYPDGGALQNSLTVKRAAELVGITVSLAHH